jgi:hypothetical protein
MKKFTARKDPNFKDTPATKQYIQERREAALKYATPCQKKQVKKGYE